MLPRALLPITKRRCKGKSGDDAIFPGFDSDEAFAKDAVITQFQRLREYTGVNPNLSMYGFRHLYIALAINSGQPIDVVGQAEKRFDGPTNGSPKLRP